MRTLIAYNGNKIFVDNITESQKKQLFNDLPETYEQLLKDKKIKPIKNK